MNSIRARLLVVMVLLVTLSLGILSVINYWKSKEILMREIEATMSEKSGDKAGEIAKMKFPFHPICTFAGNRLSFAGIEN